MSPTKTRSGTREPREAATPVSAGGAPAPVLAPGQAPATIAENGAGAGAGPMLSPPDTEAAGLQAQAAAGATVTSATVGGLWTSNHQNNCWLFLNGVGWRKLSPATVEGHHAMLQIGRLAKDSGIQVQVVEDTNIIHAIYLW
jgi:hypothetical protein